MRHALREIKYHPSRFVATLIAIAISVGFLAAASVFIDTERHAESRQQSLGFSRADVVADASSTTDSQKPATTVRAALLSIPHVRAVQQLITASLPLRAHGESVFLQLYGLPDEPFRWASLKDGRWPTTASELVLSKDAAATLQLTIGSTARPSGTDTDLTVVGITDEPGSPFLQTAYVDPSYLEALSRGSGYGQWVIAVEPGAPLPAVIAATRSTLEGLSFDDLQVRTGEDARQEALVSLTSDFDVLKYMLWAFGGIALLVGTIIVANTFTILLAQRRRQVGLLRAVGASGSQVRRRFLFEALLLGAVGSALGVALGVAIGTAGAAFTKALFWGLSLPWRELAIAFTIGVALTVVAAVAPAFRATRVAPLEALQPVATVEVRRRASIVRAVVCSVLALAGAVLAVVSLRTSENNIVLAVGSGFFISLGVLFAAPLYVPALLRLLGVFVGRTGATSKLAALNAVRNPNRASATATALMLAIGLIVALQVGMATARATALTEVDKAFPIDISLAGTHQGEPASLDAAITRRVAAVPGVAASVLLPAGSGLAEVDAGEKGFFRVYGFSEDLGQINASAPRSLRADEVLVSTHDLIKDGAPLTVGREGGKGKTLTARRTALLASGELMVTPATLAAVADHPARNAVMWLSVPDRSQATDVVLAVDDIIGTAQDDIELSGSIVSARMIETVIDTLLLVTSALLGVAVLIALIGVGNTLGLSVIERTRESALMRALGLQRSSLRLMLTIEAILLALVGVLVGVVAGVFFGWLGTRALFAQMSDSTPITAVFAVDLPQTLAMVAVAVLAAALASVLPGRKAATAPPTEALADI